MQDFIDSIIPLANELADEAGKIIRPYFRANVDVEHKSDESPVTVADRAVEQRLREIIEAKRPEDGIIGEEYGTKASKNQYDWVLDPIDGTKSFIAGRPSFGTLIALCENNVPILGIIDQPIVKERWVGVTGQPTLFNGKPVKTRQCGDLSEAKLASTSPYYLNTSPPYPPASGGEEAGLTALGGEMALWEKLRQESDFLIWGGDCYSFGLLANGYLDSVLESGLSPYDFAALPPIINGAGGHMCDWEGKPLTTKSDGRVLAVGDIALKDQILDILR